MPSDAHKSLRWLVAFLLPALGCGATAPRPQPCTVVGSSRKEEDLATLYRERNQTLVIVDEEVLVCGCDQPRLVAGATQNRTLAGATEQRDLGGATQQRDLKGATQDRDLKGATQQRDLGGATQQRDLQGATQQRDLGGATQPLPPAEPPVCQEDRACGGYRIKGGGRVFLYDGRGLREIPDRCVVR